MADYLPLQVLEIRETKTDEGEIRKSAVCRTVQPEQFNLNLSRLDAARLQRFNDNVGNIIMVPVRRGEINGRAYTSIADGHIFRDSDVVATFELGYQKQEVLQELPVVNQDKPAIPEKPVNNLDKNKAFA